MPYYRVLIWTKRRKVPYSGIRLIGMDNINAVHKSMLSKAKEMYMNDFVYIEVQMLSKLSTAITELERRSK